MRQRDEAFEAFFMAEHGPVLRTVTLILGDRHAAEDVTQEAFYRLLVHWRKVSQYERPGAWVRRVAIRIAVRARGGRGRETTEPCPAPSAPSDLGGAVDLRLALRALSPAQRTAVVLFYYEDLPVGEVASLMEVSGGAVKTHLHRARKHLAETLGEELNDVPR
jgi:DNA-directed RNA polymerase specialized sigma24 family protein